MTQLPGVPIRVLEERVFFLRKEIWEQQKYGNWLLFLLDGEEREEPFEPIRDEEEIFSLSQILSETKEEKVSTLSDVLSEPLVKIPEVNPFEIIAELSELLQEYVIENNTLSLLVSQKEKPLWYREYKG
ncbi:hypothetical protein ISTM_21 [Insectomime virus]|uniref:Uncharacterized protein n=1 Tax=Tunisvirus fontaine2 TaxID=1421067 RepID=V9SGX0_9VIRU|nr:hypothetical protein D1R32_gp305 [Tunisvirus fontaine2]AHA45919.1 hypothetical protein ISTM_21 [Insectomime virus]AHC55022.1 hypothetical protein TNS_ORF304 [Tunisvirus fontaine2]